MSQHAQQAVIAVLSAIGGVAMLGAVVSYASEGTRSEWFGRCVVVVLVSFGLLGLMGVR